MTAEDQARADIEEVLAGVPPEHEGETPQSALPSDEWRASQYLHRLGMLRREKATVEAVYQRVMLELAERRDAQLAPLVAAIEWLEQVLSLWHEARLQEDPKRKTISLLSGVLSASKAQDQWEYTDEETFLKWAHDYAPGAVRIPPQPAEQVAKLEARKLLTDDVSVDAGKVIFKPTGEVVPGLVIRKGGKFQNGRHFKQKPAGAPAVTEPTDEE